MSDLTKEAVKEGVLAAIQEIAADQDLVDHFWETGFNKFVRHGRNKASGWLFDRMFSALGGALIALGVWLVVKFGGFKI